MHATMSSGVRARACWRADGRLSRGDAPSGERLGERRKWSHEWSGLLSGVGAEREYVFERSTPS